MSAAPSVRLRSAGLRLLDHLLLLGAELLQQATQSPLLCLSHSSLHQRMRREHTAAAAGLGQLQPAVHRLLHQRQTSRAAVRPVARCPLQHTAALVHALMAGSNQCLLLLPLPHRVRRDWDSSCELRGSEGND